MRITRILSYSLTALLFCDAVAIAEDQPTLTEQKIIDGGAPAQKVNAFANVETCWKSWLADEGLVEGKNDRGDHKLLVTHGKIAIGEAPDSRNWVMARSVRFQQAELNSRKTLSESMKVLIASDRKAATEIFGGNDAPSSLKPVVEQLSIAEKGRVLTDKALDAEIRKYDSKWNGADPKQKIVTLQEKFSENIRTATDIFASGAFTAVQCEGPSAEDDGKYSVLVGMIWSPNLLKVAESIWNSNQKPPLAEPSISLAEHFTNFTNANPDWMAYSSGARIYTNEKGERVVVGFGVAPKTSLMVADKDRAKLSALSAIQRFVGEKLVAKSSSATQFERREYSDADAQSFDSSTYRSQIEAVANDMKLVGATEVHSWRGEHPWSKAGMQVVAVAWSPSWAADSRATADMMRAAEESLRRQGMVPNAPNKPEAGKAGTQSAGGGAGAATNARSGAQSSTRGF